jgi:Pyridoxamine 5'-phosphate oxidase
MAAHDGGEAFEVTNESDARAIVDANAYLTLATADAAGTPWASPVWFAHDGYVRFVWVSRPDARHSQNVAARPEVGIVVFDSTVPVGGAQAVYVEATAEVVGDADLEGLIGVFSRRSEAQGGPPWTAATSPAMPPIACTSPGPRPTTCSGRGTGASRYDWATPDSRRKSLRG